MLFKLLLIGIIIFKYQSVTQMEGEDGLGKTGMSGFTGGSDGDQMQQMIDL